VDLQNLLFMFFGGLGIFLFGIKFMGDGLQKAAGDRLRDILDRFTTNPLMGILAGILVTVLLQTSTGTTVLTIGLVSAGFMNLRQAIGVIMGANIGTTVTAFIIGIKISDYSLPIIFVGAFLLFFIKTRAAKNMGEVVFGFGALFLGLDLMGTALKPLREVQAFVDLTISMSDNPILGVVIGTIFTVAVQSSSASIGLLQTLFGQGALTLDAALPVLFGDNIGTTITAVLASIGASIAARRAAFVHVIFNIFGAIIVLILLRPYTAFIGSIQQSMSLSPEMTIAFAHGIFNVLNTILQFPFIAFLAWTVTKLIPGQDSVVEYKAKHLDPRVLANPSVALGQVKMEIKRMGEIVSTSLSVATQYVTTSKKKHGEMVLQLEEATNSLDKKISDFLVQIGGDDLSPEESRKYGNYYDIIRDLERVGDHTENIKELIDYRIENSVSFSEEAYKDLQEMFDLTFTTLNQALQALDEDNFELANSVKVNEEKIDKMERSLRKKHILRTNQGLCTGSAGIVFVDIVSNLERIGDHAVNIAETLTEE
jgi:phosphate:Na+ symporter